jgi:hypothetical protein
MTTNTLVQAAESNLIRSGDILHVRNRSSVGRAIRRAVGSWGNHDALIVRDCPTLLASQLVSECPALASQLAAGDASWPRARITPLAEYDRRIASGKTQVIVLRPVGATAIQGSLAAAWWISNVNGKPYDIAAFPRLILKSIVGDRCQWPAGWEWAWYCTESCRDAWRNGAACDPWAKNNPTPRTTEKRAAAGSLSAVWSSVVPPMPLPAGERSESAPPALFPLTNAKFTAKPDPDILVRNAIQGFTL